MLVIITKRRHAYHKFIHPYKKIGNSFITFDALEV